MFNVTCGQASPASRVHRGVPVNTSRTLLFVLKIIVTVDMIISISTGVMVITKLHAKFGVRLRVSKLLMDALRRSDQQTCVKQYTPKASNGGIITEPQ